MDRSSAIPFSRKALCVLTHFEETKANLAFTQPDGPLEKEIRSFLVLAAASLKTDCEIRDWRHRVEASSDRYIWVQLFPEAWELPNDLRVGFNIRWSNPFAGLEDLAVELFIPWNWCNAKSLSGLVASNIPEVFTNVYDGDADPSIPYWTYIHFQDFIQNEVFDVEAFYQAILAAFRDLLKLRPYIDDYLLSCSRFPEGRTARRDLGIVAVVDTETVGVEHELVELAVVLAAYDRHTGEVFGILEQYEGVREPQARISRADQRTNGLGIEQVRGQILNEEKARALLHRADFVLARSSLSP